jgi:hypothetical protein
LIFFTGCKESKFDKGKEKRENNKTQVLTRFGEEKLDFILEKLTFYSPN